MARSALVSLWKKLNSVAGGFVLMKGCDQTCTIPAFFFRENMTSFQEKKFMAGVAHVWARVH
jgi:hypothetical protein